MRKFLPALFLVPALTACEEFELPFVAPVSVNLPAVDMEPSHDGLFHYTEASEIYTLDQLRDELPAELQGIDDIRITGLTLHEPSKLLDPEFDTIDQADELLDPEFDTITDEERLLDPEFDTLADFAVQVRVFISTDQVRSPDDKLLAVVERFDPEAMDHHAVVTEYAQLSQYEQGGFALIVEADFSAMPPAEMSLPMTLRGMGAMDPTEAFLAD